MTDFESLVDDAKLDYDDLTFTTAAGEWGYFTESTRFVFQSPCGEYVAKFFDTTDTTATDQSMGEYLAWQVIDTKQTLRDAFVPTPLLFRVGNFHVNIQPFHGVENCLGPDIHDLLVSCGVESPYDWTDACYWEQARRDDAGIIKIVDYGFLATCDNFLRDMDLYPNLTEGINV